MINYSISDYHTFSDKYTQISLPNVYIDIGKHRIVWYLSVVPINRNPVRLEGHLYR
jgi:hypothetical protein